MATPAHAASPSASETEMLDAVAALKLRGGALHLPPRMRAHLWALYKQGKDGDAPASPSDGPARVDTPGSVDIDRDKLLAWSDLRGMPRAHARGEYVRAVRTLLSGKELDLSTPLWTPTGASPAPAPHSNGSASIDAHVVGEGGVRGTRKASISAPVGSALPSTRTRMSSLTGPSDPVIRRSSSSVYNAPVAGVVARCGFLLKQREMWKSWRVRWCELVGREMRYYEHKHDTAPRKVILLLPGTVVAAVDAASLRKPGKQALRDGEEDTGGEVRASGGRLRAAGAVSMSALTKTPASRTRAPDALISASVGAAFYPFCVYHARTASTKYYWACSNSEEERDAWMSALRAAADGALLIHAAADAHEQADGGESEASAPSVAEIRGSARIVTPALAPAATPAPVATTNRTSSRVDPIVATPAPAPAPRREPQRVMLSLPLKRYYAPADIPSPWADDVHAHMTRLLSLANSNDAWKYTTTTNSVRMYVSADGGTSARGDGFIPYPRAVIREMIADIATKHETDSQFEHGEYVEVINPQTSVTYMRFKGAFTVSPRDMCTLTHWRVCDDGTFLVCAASCVHERCPVRSGVVRAQLHIGGWVLRPAPGPAALASDATSQHPHASSDPRVDARGCDATYLMLCDFAGTVPGFITAQVGAQQALIVAKVRDALDKKYKPGGVHGPARLAQLRTRGVYNDPGEQLRVRLEAGESIPDDEAPAVEAEDVEHETMEVADFIATTPPNAAAAAQRAVSAPAPVQTRRPPPRVYSLPLPVYLPPDSLAEPWASMLATNLRTLHSLVHDMSVWKSSGTAENVRMYVATDGCVSARGEGHIPFSRARIHPLIADVSTRGETDDRFVSGRYVHVLNHQTHVTYMRFSGVLSVSPRDMCVLSHWRVCPDGTLVVCASSIEVPECPPVKECVRAQLHIGGWVVRPRGRETGGTLRQSGNGEWGGSLRSYACTCRESAAPCVHADPCIDAAGCDVTYVMRTDMRGSIPGFIASMVGAQQAKLIARVKDAITKKKSSASAAPSALVNPAETVLAARVRSGERVLMEGEEEDAAEEDVTASPQVPAPVSAPAAPASQPSVRTPAARTPAVRRTSVPAAPTPQQLDVQLACVYGGVCGHVWDTRAPVHDDSGHHARACEALTLHRHCSTCGDGREYPGARAHAVLHSVVCTHASTVHAITRVQGMICLPAAAMVAALMDASSFARMWRLPAQPDHATAGEWTLANGDCVSVAYNVAPARAVAMRPIIVSQTRTRSSGEVIAEYVYELQPLACDRGVVQAGAAVHSHTHATTVSLLVFNHGKLHVDEVSAVTGVQRLCTSVNGAITQHPPRPAYVGLRWTTPMLESDDSSIRADLSGVYLLLLSLCVVLAHARGCEYLCVREHVFHSVFLPGVNANALTDAWCERGCGAQPFREVHAYETSLLLLARLCAFAYLLYVFLQSCMRSRALLHVHMLDLQLQPVLHTLAALEARIGSGVRTATVSALVVKAATMAYVDMYPGTTSDVFTREESHAAGTCIGTQTYRDAHSRSLVDLARVVAPDVAAPYISVLVRTFALDEAPPSTAPRASVPAAVCIDVLPPRSLSGAISSSLRISFASRVRTQERAAFMRALPNALTHAGKMV